VDSVLWFAASYVPLTLAVGEAHSQFMFMDQFVAPDEPAALTSPINAAKLEVSRASDAASVVSLLQSQHASKLTSGPHSWYMLLEERAQTRGLSDGILWMFILLLIIGGILSVYLLWHNNWNMSATGSEAKRHVHSAASSVERRTRESPQEGVAWSPVNSSLGPHSSGQGHGGPYATQPSSTYPPPPRQQRAPVCC